MAVVIHSESTAHFSISRFISKLRSKRSTRRSQQPTAQDARPPLNPLPLPLVLPEHQQSLPHLGWTTITFPQPSSSHGSPSATKTENEAPGFHPLQSAYQALFLAAQEFFDSDDEEKKRWKHRLGSEEGWSKIPGEKEFITLRTLAYTPDSLKVPAKRYWDLMGNHLSSTLDRISTSLDLPHGEDHGLRRFVGPCATMGAQEEHKTSTMLRIFRYEGWDAKVVAEAHADLGLLSCVVGDVPGLEVWDGHQFFDIEKHYVGPSATMLGGRQLERYSNFRYQAGGHRVVSYGRPALPLSLPAAHDTAETVTEEKKYRHSIVFVLRAHEPVVVNSDELETRITGKWAEPVRNKTAGKMYEEIRSAHFNINIGIEERERQRRKMQKGKIEENAKESDTG